MKLWINYGLDFLGLWIIYLRLCFFLFSTNSEVPALCTELYFGVKDKKTEKSGSNIPQNSSSDEGAEPAPTQSTEYKYDAEYE